jgi:putative transposase
MCEMSNAVRPGWAHAPPHRLTEGGCFIVTAGTYRKEHIFDGSNRLRVLRDGLLRYARKHKWHLDAWAVFPNHYHFVGHSPDAENPGAASLTCFIADFHQHSAAWINAQDQQQNRRVWCNYWETRITFEKSYLARLHYVHQNAVKHGLVPVANQYPWCSAAWFEKEASPAMVKTVYSFATDRIKVADDF